MCCCITALKRDRRRWGPRVERTIDKKSIYVLGDLQVTVFQQEHYLENFVQSTFDALPEEKLTGKSRHLYTDGHALKVPLPCPTDCLYPLT